MTLSKGTDSSEFVERVGISRLNSQKLGRLRVDFALFEHGGGELSDH